MRKKDRIIEVIFLFCLCVLLGQSLYLGMNRIKFPKKILESERKIEGIRSHKTVPPFRTLLKERNYQDFQDHFQAFNSELNQLQKLTKVSYVNHWTETKELITQDINALKGKEGLDFQLNLLNENIDEQGKFFASNNWRSLTGILTSLSHIRFFKSSNDLYLKTNLRKLEDKLLQAKKVAFDSKLSVENKKEINSRVDSFHPMIVKLDKLIDHSQSLSESYSKFEEGVNSWSDQSIYKVEAMLQDEHQGERSLIISLLALGFVFMLYAIWKNLLFKEILSKQGSYKKEQSAQDDKMIYHVQNILKGKEPEIENNLKEKLQGVLGEYRKSINLGEMISSAFPFEAVLFDEDKRVLWISEPAKKAYQLKKGQTWKELAAVLGQASFPYSDTRLKAKENGDQDILLKPVKNNDQTFLFIEKESIKEVKIDRSLIDQGYKSLLSLRDSWIQYLGMMEREEDLGKIETATDQIVSHIRDLHDTFVKIEKYSEHKESNLENNLGA